MSTPLQPQIKAIGNDPPRVCPTCSAEDGGLAEFCPKCGQRLRPVLNWTPAAIIFLGFVGIPFALVGGIVTDIYVFGSMPGLGWFSLLVGLGVSGWIIWKSILLIGFWQRGHPDS